MTSQIHFKKLDEILGDISKLDTDQILVVVDENISSLYQSQLETIREKSKKTVEFWIAPPGESCKTLKNLEICLEHFLSKNIHRNSHLVAIGGGAITDFAGLCASLLLRGIKWSVISTTLLGMVDASIGGKVAINSQHGKNLIGDFYLPENIWIDTQFLKTLDSFHIRSGLGEMIKYAFLSEKIHEMITNDESVDAIIKACASYKKSIIERDLHEGGVRKILNLGHTFGHIYEFLYKIPHGEAVYWGMYTMFLLEDQKDLLNSLSLLTKKLNIDFSVKPWTQYPLDKVKFYLGKDKKRVDQESIDVVSVEKIGDVTMKKTLMSTLVQKVTGKRNELE